MGIAIVLSAFVLTFLGTRASLGAGISVMLCVGYLNGIIRANFLGMPTTFLFDAAVAGLYAAQSVLRSGGSGDGSAVEVPLVGQGLATDGADVETRVGGSRKG